MATPTQSKYLINCDTRASLFNAGQKAPSDICHFLEEEGYTVIHNRYMLYNRILRLPLIILYPIYLSFFIKRESYIVFQHPYDSLHDAIRIMNRILLKILKAKKCHTTVLIHDIASLRAENWSAVPDEINCLNSFGHLIAHSQEMKSYLEEHGYKNKITLLGLFDYNVEKPSTMERILSKEVVFAGNLEKSEFLKTLENPEVQINLYGKKVENLKEFFSYRGFFKSDDVSAIEGSWGLVWDGDSPDCCSGPLGRYLKYNSPHKASLYLCAGLPLIVPTGSAVADFVKRKNLGLVVDSLYGISSAIDSITPEQYGQMCSNARQEGTRLQSGENIKEAVRLQFG